MQNEFILIYSRSGSWGTRVFPPLQSVLSPPACVGTQSVLPCSVRTPCWPPVSPALHTPSTRIRTPRALLRGGGCRCSEFSPATHFSLGKIPPPPRWVSTDGSKQRLQGFCSTAIAFLPPTKRSDGGNTAVGHRARVLQPKGDSGLRPILDLRRLNFSLYKGKFKMLTIKAIMSQIHDGDWFVTIDLKDACFHIQVIQSSKADRRAGNGQESSSLGT